MFGWMDDLQAALNIHWPRLMAHIPDYTNTRATIQISGKKNVMFSNPWAVISAYATLFH